MRAVLLLATLACLSGCTTPLSAPRLTAEEARHMCLSRMYTARMRGAVHWQIYDNCLKEHS